ncbi:MAG TPA: hypothetical protein VLM91_06435, partial [Candidatus Methylomirabilis sp.]|nr:hypothetical protein [Candidatus Methylomirabilis sp.]
LPVFKRNLCRAAPGRAEGNHIKAAGVLGLRRAYLSRLLKTLEPRQSSQEKSAPDLASSALLYPFVTIACIFFESVHVLGSPQTESSARQNSPQEQTITAVSAPGLHSAWILPSMEDIRMKDVEPTNGSSGK